MGTPHHQFHLSRARPVIVQHMNLPCQATPRWNGIIVGHFLGNHIVPRVEIHGPDPKGKTETVRLDRRVIGEQTRGHARRILPAEQHRTSLPASHSPGSCSTCVVNEIDGIFHQGHWSKHGKPRGRLNQIFAAVHRVEPQREIARRGIYRGGLHSKIRGQGQPGVLHQKFNILRPEHLAIYLKIFDKRRGRERHQVTSVSRSPERKRCAIRTLCAWRSVGHRLHPVDIQTQDAGHGIISTGDVDPLGRTGEQRNSRRGNHGTKKVALGPVIATHEKFHRRRTGTIVIQYMHLPGQPLVAGYAVIERHFLGQQIIKRIDADRIDPERKTETVLLQRGMLGIQPGGNRRRIHMQQRGRALDAHPAYRRCRRDVIDQTDDMRTGIGKGRSGFIQMPMGDKISSPGHPNHKP